MRNRNSVSIKPQRACKRAAVFFILALLPASCDLPQAPGRKGALSVALPGAHKDPRAIKLPGYLIEGMIYRLEFSGPGKTQSRTARSGDTVTLDLEPGRWRIEVDAFYLRPGTLEILIEEKTPLEEWFDIEFAVPAGKGSIDAEVIAGRQNQISIPLSVLDEFAVPGVGGYDASRVWAGGSVGAYLEEAVFETQMEYQWYVNTADSAEGGTLFAGEGANSAECYTDPSGREIMYYYCEVSYIFDSSGGGEEKRLVYTAPVTVVPRNSDGLQYWIDQESGDWPVELPSGVFAMTSAVTVKGKDIRLLANADGTTLLRQQGHGGAMFDAESGTLALGGAFYGGGVLVLDGGKDTAGGMADSLVKIESGGTLEIGDNVVLTGNRAENGGAVHVSPAAAFVMKGGTISGNEAADGGGVYIGAGGAFSMTGGDIYGNTAEGTEESGEGHYLTGGGGVYVSGGSAFTMSSGAIGGDSLDLGNAAPSGGGVYVAGGGVFTMTGGLINCNYAFSNGYNGQGGGVYVNGGNAVFTMSGGVIGPDAPENMDLPRNGNLSVSDGGGVYVGNGAVFTMSGNAKIQYNSTGTDVMNSGGGVCVSGEGSAFTMDAGTLIKSNSASFKGGGVTVFYGASFTMNGGEICDNAAPEGYGGGVYVEESGGAGFTMNPGALIRSNTAASGGGAGLGLRGVFIMNGGEISDNAAVAVNSYTGNGGGVDASGNYTGGGEAVFTMRGNAAISGNAASVSGGGVYVNNASFAMSGGARVNPGNEIFLCEDQVISVEGNLTADAPAAAIQPETYPLGGALTAIKILDGETADVAANNAKFSVLPRAEGEQWAIDPDGNLYLAAYLVTNTNDAGTGSLRQAIALASGGDTIKLDLPPGSEIRLESSLEIDKNLTIEGNGVTLTRNLSVGPIQLAQIGNFTVTVRRVRFTGGGGDTVSQGGAIFSDAAYLALESCIFSNNYASTNGGAVINNNAAGTLDIKGCTFYSNSTSYYYGGAVYNSGDLVLTGNLFYGNTAPYGPVAGPYFPGTITSAGYNMVDKPFGTGFDDCGWDQVAGDRQITGLSFSPLTYKVFPDSEMTAIPVLPENYPSFDFYGNAINPGNWYPGAVQSTTAAGMNYLDLAYDAGRGGVTVNPLPDPDGLVPEGTALAVTASAGYEFLQWLRWQWVEDEWSPGEYIFEPVEYDTAVLLLNGMEKYTKVEAVFGLAVTSAGDGPASEQTPGTLRFALAQARDGDLIRVSVPEIYLTRRLVVDIESNSGVTIEGGGVKLARQEPYTADGDPGLLSVSGYGVTMRGTHFTGGSTEGNGGAVSVFGDLTLQSCIFSGNSADNDGGAVYVSGQSYVRIAGCTFYNNSAGSAGGAVCFNAVYSTNQLILTGNLFYGNTAGQCTVNILWGTLSPSYNVVDLDYGTANGQIGWAADPTDNLFYHSLGGGLGITDDPPFDPETFAPVAGLEDVMPDQDTVSTYVIFPATDFYGNERTWPGAPGAVNSEQ